MDKTTATEALRAAMVTMLEDPELEQLSRNPDITEDDVKATASAKVIALLAMQGYAIVPTETARVGEALVGIEAKGWEISLEWNFDVRPPEACLQVVSNGPSVRGSVLRSVVGTGYGSTMLAAYEAALAAQEGDDAAR